MRSDNFFSPSSEEYLGYGDAWSVVEDRIFQRLQNRAERTENSSDEEPPPRALETTTKAFYRAARQKPLAERQWLARNSLNALLSKGGPGDRYVAEFCVQELGEAAGRQLLFVNRDEDDELADGVARGWAGQPNRLFEELREFPREDVRKRLCCLIPVHRDDGVPVTRLDPRVSGDAALAEFERRCLSGLICDRSREVRRLARISRRLTCCAPGTLVDYYSTLTRWLEQRAASRRPWFGTRRCVAKAEHSRIGAKDVADACDALRQCTVLGTQPSLELVIRAIALMADVSASWVDLEDLESAVINCRTLDWGSVLAAPALARVDDHFALALLMRADAPNALRRAFAVRALWSDEIAAELATSRNGLTDPVVREFLCSCDWPHVLYALAGRGALEAKSRVFGLLVESDIDRAARLVLGGAPKVVTISRSRWREALERCSAVDRMRLRKVAPLIDLAD